MHTLAVDVEIDVGECHVFLGTNCNLDVPLSEAEIYFMLKSDETMTSILISELLHDKSYFQALRPVKTGIDDAIFDVHVFDR